MFEWWTSYNKSNAAKRKQVYLDAAELIRKNGLLKSGNYYDYKTKQACVLGAVYLANGNTINNFGNFSDQPDFLGKDKIFTKEIAEAIEGHPIHDVWPRDIFYWNDYVATSVDAIEVLEKAAKKLDD